MYKLIALSFSTLLTLLLNAQPSSKPLFNLVRAFSRTSAVTGREKEAADFVQSLFSSNAITRDRLGNVILTIGSGAPRRLFTAPLDEPGYVVSAIQDNGYLHLTPVGYGHSGTMYHQFLQGNDISIGTQNGSVPGVVVVPSSHYEGLRSVQEASKPVYRWQEAFVDVGQASAKGVAQKGIQLLDPLTLTKKPAVLADTYLAAPAAKQKASVMALATVAKTLQEAKFSGTVVIAFTTLELINGKGIEAVVNQYGPFDQVIRFNRFLAGETSDAATTLVDRPLHFSALQQATAKPEMAFRHPATNSPAWDTTKLYGIGLPSRYTNTPVEMVSVKDVEQLVQTWLHAVEDRSWKLATISPKELPASEQRFNSFQNESSLLSSLVAKYGVSSSEKPVREFILSRLPKWAKPIVDEKGNLALTFGKGMQHIGFVAHMDEVGYVVDSIRSNGMLVLKQKGGFFNFVWEAHAAILHTGAADIPAVFEPREGYLTAIARANGVKSPTVFAGFRSRTEAQQAGVVEGVTTVTMPKKMVRLSEEKAAARGFDDRVGCAALLAVLQTINPDALPFTVTFIWSVEEEAGLAGATYAAKNFKDLQVIYPIDTYVSSDDPVDPRLFGYCPLGEGAVIRVLESVNFMRREDLTYLRQLAARNKIKSQYGMTAGGTDGQAFLANGIPSVPLSWPGRYSHSPVEVMDFRDMNSLVQLIKSIMTDKNKTYK